jgi:DNA adenine methylase
MAFISPLRYPGGKGRLGPYFARILADQSQVVRTYAEPYAGGAGAGLFLLEEGYIDELFINDLNPGIAAFWRSVLNYSNDFVARIESQKVTMEAWHEARAIYLSPGDHSDFDLGFATFFLNRCNRSGILTARPIGGLEQTGKWKIDARFNRVDLAGRVRKIASLASAISVTEMTAIDFLTSLSGRAKPILFYVDPPYLIKGEDLYMSAHSWADHEELASHLLETRHPWILTYDVDERLRQLYPKNRCLNYSISHTAQSQKVGSEYMFFSRALRVTDLTVVVNRKGSWVA